MDRPAFTRSLWTWIVALVEPAPAASRPIVVGFSAPQGAGKTTLTADLLSMAVEAGIRATTVSIDDFYLTRAEQLVLSHRHSGLRFLAHRGYPGTHDVALGTRVLAALKSIGAAGEVCVPSYDRSAFKGQGDRRPESAWPRVTWPLDLVIFEGWMLGFRPVAASALDDPDLRVVNAYLEAYAAWTALLDAFIRLEPTDARFVVDWRAEAEAQARAEGRLAMTDAEVRAFADDFLPAYETYLPTLRDVRPGPVLHVTIGRDRLPI